MHWSDPTIYSPQRTSSFSQFMERALYDPEHGYYASGRVCIGKAGDFFTNVSVGKIYGKVLALFFEELWEKMGQPHYFTIVEQGANDGRLASDILEAIEASPDFLKSIRYSIVEPFSIHQKKQQETLKNQKNVFWVKKIEDLSEFEGIHFSNELLDAFPVDLLHWDGKEWLEQRVIESAPAEFSWITVPIQQEKLEAVAAQLPRNLESGFLWEVRLGIRPWLQQLKTKLQRGMILIADYGYAGPQRFASYRAQGSIACYQKHQRFNNPLEKVGERDITSHLDFTDLAEKAVAQHFEILGYSDQHHFLIGAAEAWLRNLENREHGDLLQKGSVYHNNAMAPSVKNYGTDPVVKELRLFQTLLHPETMGRSFQFLGLGKNFSSPLSGFRYQRPGVDYLFET